MGLQRRDRVTFEFGDGEPTVGRLLAGAVTAESFRGWLGLCAAIERAWQQTGAAGAPGGAPADTGGFR